MKIHKMILHEIVKSNKKLSVYDMSRLLNTTILIIVICCLNLEKLGFLDMQKIKTTKRVEIIC